MAVLDTDRIDTVDDGGSDCDRPIRNIVPRRAEIATGKILSQI
jgi:hypothetical protein